MGRSWWTVSSQIATLANFYLTTWEEYYTGDVMFYSQCRAFADGHLGQLYLGVFSGPVEGILMIVGIYVTTGLYGRDKFSRYKDKRLTILQALPSGIRRS